MTADSMPVTGGGAAPAGGVQAPPPPEPAPVTGGPVLGFRELSERVIASVIDRYRAGRNPGAILPTALLAFAGEHSGPVRVVAEQMWSDRSGAEYPACVLHEALLKHALAGRDLAVL